MDKRKNTHIAYLSLGTNLGNRLQNLQKTLDLIKHEIGEIIKLSSIYQTEPWEMNLDSPPFLNMVIAVKTKLSPDKLLEVTQHIEIKLGRQEKSESNKYKNRIIDIDILLIDDLILNTEKLIIPHPLMDKRNFVLYPLCEIAKDVIHPKLEKSINDLKNNCSDQLKISSLNSCI
jgi:2-amino-4-hydroxy-6-hydroxymethyldihydropteridine diphosphokinase